MRRRRRAISISSSRQASEGRGEGRFLQREPLDLARTRPSPAARQRGRHSPHHTYPQPSITRRIAIEALQKAGIAWRIVCTCNSLSGLIAAAAAGMGVLVQPVAMAPAGLLRWKCRNFPRLRRWNSSSCRPRGVDQKIVRLCGERWRRGLAVQRCNWKMTLSGRNIAHQA